MAFITFWEHWCFIDEIHYHIYDDNLNYICLSKICPIFQAHTKHIKIHHHLVGKKIEENFVKLVYCNMKNMVAEFLTKGLFC